MTSGIVLEGVVDTVAVVRVDVDVGNALQAVHAAATAR